MTLPFVRFVLTLVILSLPTFALAQNTAASGADPLPEMSAIEEAWRQGDYATVRAGLKRHAEETGTPQAMFRYGRVLVEGRGGPTDLEGGISWLERAAAHHQIDALQMLAELLLVGDEIGLTRDPARAAGLLTRAATRGTAAAQYRLGLLHMRGDGIPEDPETGFNWLLAAAEQEHVEAQLTVARAFAEGRGTPRDPAEGQRWLTRAAEHGHPMAQLSLARSFDAAGDSPEVKAQALRWYQAAAEQGIPLAQRTLGMRLLTGEGASANPTLGLNWLQRAAEAGDPGAMANLGYAYATGTGTEADDVRAALWYMRAADTELPRAVTALARFHETGRGVPQDFTRALSLYRQAAELGHEPAILRLGALAGEGALDGHLAPHRAVPWARAAAAQGDVTARDWLTAQAQADIVPAAAALGTLLLDEGQVAQAESWLTRAAQGGDTAAQAALGQLHVTGSGAAGPDYIAAYMWLNVAATSGHREAAETRALIADLMTPEQIAAGQDATRTYFEQERQPPAPTESKSEPGQ